MQAFLSRAALPALTLEHRLSGPRFERGGQVKNADTDALGVFASLEKTADTSYRELFPALADLARWSPDRRGSAFPFLANISVYPRSAEIAKKVDEE